MCWPSRASPPAPQGPFVIIATGLGGALACIQAALGRRMRCAWSLCRDDRLRSQPSLRASVLPPACPRRVEWAPRRLVEYGCAAVVGLISMASRPRCVLFSLRVHQDVADTVRSFVNRKVQELMTIKVASTVRRSPKSCVRITRREETGHPDRRDQRSGKPRPMRTDALRTRTDLSPLGRVRRSMIVSPRAARAATHQVLAVATRRSCRGRTSSSTSAECTASFRECEARRT